MPDDNPTTLYYYCSNETFISILDSQKLRLSAMTMSNDSLEGEWFYKKYEDNLDCFENDAVGEHLFRTALQTKEDVQVDALGMCFSEKRDTLSQWRGYASGGAGVCIGFSVAFLKTLNLTDELAPVGFTKIIYDEEQQNEIIRSVFNEINKNFSERILNYLEVGSNYLQIGNRNKFTPNEIDEMKAKNMDWVELDTLLTLSNMYRFKNPAFEEEREWRLFSGLLYNGEVDDNIKLKSAGDKIVPFREISIDLTTELISEVILGPKNSTPVAVLNRFLKSKNYTFPVNISAASLR